AGDANHDFPVGRPAVGSSLAARHALADRILIRPCLLRERLADHHHLLPAGSIAGAEPPPALQRDPHGPRIVERDQTEQRVDGAFGPNGPESAINSLFRLITLDYPRTMRIPLKRGRWFSTSDRSGGQKVMVISETLAQQAWPNQDPIGKRMACCEAGPDGRSPDWKVVVGVAG